MFRGRRRTHSSRKGTFDPEDTTRIKHTRIGIWDLYEEKQDSNAQSPGVSRLEQLRGIKLTLPYVWQMAKDLAGMRSCWASLCIYMAAELLLSLMPAVMLWHHSQLITVVQTAVESRTVDKRLLVRITVGLILCGMISRLLLYIKSRASVPLRAKLQQHYTELLFHARARLDVPSFEDPAVRRQLEMASNVGGQSLAWSTVVMLTNLVTTSITILSQVSVLATVLRNQLDGPLYAIVCFVQSIAEVVQMEMRHSPLSSGVWAASTKNEDYVKMQGLKHLVHHDIHRKELVAGNLAEYATQLFKRLAMRVGDDAADFWEAHRQYTDKERFSILSMLRDPLRELPQIIFALRAVQYPASIPVSLASLNLITQTTSKFGWSLYQLSQQTVTIAQMLEKTRKLYDVVNITNKVPDGIVPFPEDQQMVKMGISLEFRNVSFQYAGQEEYALRNVSFKLEQGQLCVIVGSNGSGKSTILKLVVRLYDPIEGQILLDGVDIRTLKLTDLRQAVSVLFQDYSHFPLSIRDNIGLGDPSNAQDDERIRLAARLGGSEQFIDRLPDGFDTYLERPVNDYYSALPEGTMSLFGRPVSFGAIRAAGRLNKTSSSTLSGGQMQRLALSRTFMRTVVSDDSTVGLLLFDEPSASLDPTAEHDLFQRLKELRGSKTMIFSSHRFGNLTRHADLILYMNDSQIIESGTHEELLKRQGDYARIWKLQAQAFL